MFPPRAFARHATSPRIPPADLHHRNPRRCVVRVMDLDMANLQHIKSMKIDINKKYHVIGDATRTPVRILCTDAPGDFPVKFLYPSGHCGERTSDGKRNSLISETPDLIEIREPREIWINKTPSGLHHNHYQNKESAIAESKEWAPILFREVL